MNNKDIKKYHRIKLIISLIKTVIFLFLMIYIVHSDITLKLEKFVFSITSDEIMAFLLFLFLFSFSGSIINFPFSFYLEYVLEKKYQRLNQTFSSWLFDKFKSFLVSILISTPLIIIFYILLIKAGNIWWLPAGLIIFLFSIVLVRIAPTVIFPLFYKFTPLEDSTLRDELVNLAQKYNFNVDGVYLFNLSSKTLKGNAGFTGIGKSKRIIIADTIIKNFNKDEIISIFAHELGHFKLRHLWKGMLFSFITIFIGLWLISAIYDWLIPIYNFESRHQLAALPLLGLLIYLYGFLTIPLNNAVSRKYEYEADKFALIAINDKSHYMNALKKLAEMNLSEIEPNPVVEFLFYDHPSIGKRIAFAEKFYKS